MKKIIAILFVLSGCISLGQTSWGFGWAHGFGSPNQDVSYNSKVDANGNLYVIGQIFGTVDFDPGAGTNTLSANQQGFIAKYSPTGSLLWAKTFQDGLGGSMMPNAIGLDGNSQVVVAGYYSGTVDLDPGPATLSTAAVGNSDMFIIKVDLNGSLTWARSTGGVSNTFNPLDVKVDGSGNVVIVGDFNGTADFDPSGNTYTLASQGTMDGFVAKYNSSGNFLWAFNLGSALPASEQAIGVDVDASGDLYVSGYFQNSADFDPSLGGVATLTSSGQEDAFIAKYTAAGQYVWAGNIGGGAKDEGYRIAYSSSGNIYVSAISQSTVLDADPGAGTYTLSKNGTATNNTFLGKYSAATGSLVWAMNTGGTGTVGIGAYNMCLDASENIYITGFFDGVADFDMSPAVSTLTTLTSGFDIFFAKYNSSGNYIMARNVGGGTSLSNEAFAINVTNNNDIYVTGCFASNCDFDITGAVYTVTNNASTDFFISKYTQCILPTTPTLNVNNPVLCNGQSLTITVTGTLNSATNWVWSNVSCGTGSFATGTVVVVSPTTSTNYFVRGEGGCITPSTCASTSVTVNTLKSITGQVTFSGSPVAGEVVLYKNEGGFQKYDSLTKVAIDIAGNYSFTAYNPGSYMVQALPTATNLQVTYGNSAVNWKTATIINHSCVTTSSMNINVVPLVNIGQGPGMIAGKVVEGLKYGKKGEAVVPGGPIRGAMVKAGRNPGGDIVAQQRSSTTGGYTFTALPLNAAGESYFIIVDITGLDTNGTYHKVLAAGSETFTNLDFVADSAKITPGQFVGLIERSSELDHLKVYPNPSSGVIHLESKSGSAVTEVNVYDMTGKVVYQRSKEEEGIQTIDIRDLPKGIYHLRISDMQGKSAVFRVIIQE